MAHTYLEVVRVRWGRLSHLVHLFFAFAANILVGSMLVLGGSATVHQLTGMPTLAACFLTPAAVAIYTVTGGLRATFLADFSHTAVLIAILLAFSLTSYAASDKIGSPQRMWELLSEAAPVAGNAKGSYVTMRSLGGLKFGIVNICGNFAAVFCDQAYHQRGVASSPEKATKGFIMGGLAWIAVPLVISSSLGLAARALTGVDPDMAVLSAMEVSEGLAAPSAAAALLGKSGAAAMLVLLYLAVTSATSAQLIAVSSVLTYDVWKVYINPRASSQQLFWVSHISVGLWAVALGLFGLMFYYIGISMGWLYEFMGVVMAPAVFPVFACLTWSKANRMGALVGVLSGLALGIITWLVSTSQLYGALTVESTGQLDSLLAGNLVSIVVPAIITCIWSYVSPDHYTFEQTRALNCVLTDVEVSDSGTWTPRSAEDEKLSKEDSAPVAQAKDVEDVASGNEDLYKHVRQAGLDPELLKRSIRTACFVALPLAFILLVFIPCMAIIPEQFSPTGLAAWVSIWIAWLFGSAALVVFLPVWESREGLCSIFRGIWSDLRVLQ